MNEQPLDEIIAEDIDAFLARAGKSWQEQDVIDHVLADSRIQLLRRGYDDHDRSGDLEGIFVRDVRRKVKELLQTTPEREG